MVKELKLSHGEIQVLITVAGRSINWSTEKSHSLFKLELIVEILDAFDSIILTTSVQRDGLEPWILDNEYRVRDLGDCETLDDANKMAGVLMEHGFKDAFIKVL